METERPLREMVEIEARDYCSAHQRISSRNRGKVDHILNIY